jgi:signal transduction histidine kinase
LIRVRASDIVNGMSRQGYRTNWLLRAAIVLAIWMCLAVVLTGQASLLVYLAAQAQADLPRARPPMAFGELLLSSFAECFIWALLTLGILWLGTHVPFTRRTWLRSLAIHVVACLGCGILEAALSTLLAEVIRSEFPKPTVTINVFSLYFAAKLNNSIFFYWTIVTVAHVLNYYRALRERDLRASELEARLAQTQLQVLKMQLHPHFLFNTLNAISALIHQDVELADRMIARLGDLLRTTLDNANQQEVPLRQELDFIQPYLEIEKARLGPRLTVDLAIDCSVMDARLPNLILQPLVENAIRHGISVRPGPGTIRITAGRDNGSLRIAVADSGPGMPLDGLDSKGIGLANTRARLEKLYGAAQRLDLRSGPDGGLEVDITIPYHEACHGDGGEVA